MELTVIKGDSKAATALAMTANGAIVTPVRSP